MDLKFEFDENDTFFVYGGRAKLWHVFAHLIDNCLKFTSDGRIDIYLTRYSDNASDNKPYAKVSIRDTGIGIEPGMLSHLKIGK